MSEYLCVCVCVCMCVFVFMCVCAYTYMCVYIHIYMCVCVKISSNTRVVERFIPTVMWDSSPQEACDLLPKTWKAYSHNTLVGMLHPHIFQPPVVGQVLQSTGAHYNCEDEENVGVSSLPTLHETPAQLTFSTPPTLKVVPPVKEQHKRNRV